ncbi:VOC family protein [Mesonia aestuariivivens]|uniref:VOC family protein n=1 Tax=Mesonia aestuariivivens TaxID=2796128 RepID=A0ABS6W246_9FLAO|nr:VOC family protein [Mesonia aestuariivivens]MBW2961199.1 VOC family protein [Mesonia aestuariivivens]
MKIKQLHIYTQNLAEQKKFYEEVLDLPVRKIGSNVIQVLLGFSEIFMEEDLTAKPYHFAFHVMPCKIEEAKNWLENKVKLLTFEEQAIIDFSNWNAKSLYFYDENKNIVEFISRQNLFPETEKPFNAEQILGIAEIGLVTDNVGEKFNFLQQEFGLEQYDGDLEKFCAVGDDLGLFITINQQEKDWFPINDKPYVADFQVAVQHQEKDFAIRFKNNQLVKINE